MIGSELLLRYKTFVVFKSVTFDQIFLQIFIGIKINTFWAFSENFKSDTFENHKSFVTVEVQSHYQKYIPEIFILLMTCWLQSSLICLFILALRICVAVIFWIPKAAKGAGGIRSQVSSSWRIRIEQGLLYWWCE